MTQLRTIPLAIAAMGMTVDGREITEQNIDDIVATYNYKKYGARINLDHEGDWSGWVAKNILNVDLNGGMLGDVLSVEKGTNSEGATVLYAVLAPNASFVALNQADQAVYFSIEIDRDFMGSGKTYLTGLAVTDYPASTYTDRIKFNKKNHSQSDNKDDSLLKVDLGELKTEKKSLFHNLFNFKKDEPEMTEAQLAEALKQSLSGPLAQFTSALNANTEATTQLLQKFGDQNGKKPKVNDDEESSDDDNFGDQNGSTPKDPKDKTKSVSVSTDETSDEFSALDGKFTSLEEKVDKLSNALDKALKSPSSHTTDSDEEHEDENGKYSNLL